MAQLLVLSYERVYLFSILLSVVLNVDAANRFGDMNPILRYRFASQLKDRLKILSSFTKKQSLNSRNCFFSPVQCQLPVTAIDDMETLSKRRLRAKPW